MMRMMMNNEMNLVCKDIPRAREISNKLLKKSGMISNILLMEWNIFEDVDWEITLVIMI